MTENVDFHVEPHLSLVLPVGVEGYQLRPMILLDSIERWIIEHGGSAILKQQLEFAKEQYSAMEGKVTELQTQVGRLEGQLDRERTDHKQARDELQRLKDEHSEEIRIHSAVEFRRGKRTGGQWMGFCPKCRMPASEETPVIFCSAKCGWNVIQPMPLAGIISGLNSPRHENQYR